MELVDTMLARPFFQIFTYSRYTAKYRRFAHSIQTADERGPRLLARDQSAAAGPLKPIAAPPQTLGAGREAVFTSQIELVHVVCVLLWRAAGQPSWTVVWWLGGQQTKA